MNSDFKNLLKLFNRFKARYLIVGGHAVMKYTEPRFTKDLDIWVEATPENASLVFKALREFGAPLTNLGEADFAKEGFFYQMGRPPTRVDILMSIEGLKFGDAWPKRVESDFDGVSVHVISREDLIANKVAVGRPQDLIDVGSLQDSERLDWKPKGQSTARQKKRGSRKKEGRD
jgi:hypothetical protein